MRYPSTVTAQAAPASAASSSLDADFALMTMDEIAAIYRISTSTIRKLLAAGTFRPLPIALRPYRWRKEDITADIELRAKTAADLNAQRVLTLRSAAAQSRAADAPPRRRSRDTRAPKRRAR